MGILATRYPADTKLSIQRTDPANVNNMKREKFSLIMPATIGANVRIIGKNKPAVNARPPYFL